jgi:SagB-type dehydrogenase family enzyme
MTLATHVSLAPGATLTHGLDGRTSLRGAFGELSIAHPSDDLRASLDLLREEGAAERALARRAGVDAAALFYHLESAAERCLLCWTIVHVEAPLLRLVQLAPDFDRRLGGYVGEDEERRLSPFASARAVGERMILEGPLARASVVLLDPRMGALVFELSRPSTATALAARIGGLDPHAARAALQMLADAGLLAPRPGGDPRAQSEVVLQQWEPHDLAFHVASRRLRPPGELGGTFRFEGAIPPPPVLEPSGSGERVALYRPDIDALRGADVPFTEVLERRRSVCRRGPEALTVRQLGELLFRSARVRAVRPASGGDVTDRPYPGAGARYELELYPVVDRCDGLESGLYHYRPMEHRLERLGGATRETRALLDGAQAVGGSAEPPDVLFVVAARFQRVAWKYQSIAYSLILKDTGVLLQTMCLVATAMSLAPCPLGWGDPDLFARAARTDPLVEASVGELWLSR